MDIALRLLPHRLFDFKTRIIHNSLKSHKLNEAPVSPRTESPNGTNVSKADGASTTFSIPHGEQEVTQENPESPGLAHNANSAIVGREIQEMYPGVKTCFISGDGKKG